MRKLQINLAGSWRDVLRFDEVAIYDVRIHARNLAQLADGKPSMRIADESNTCLERLCPPEYKWVNVR